MVTEEIQEVREGENVHRSTEQHKHLQRARERSDRETSGPSGLSRWTQTWWHPVIEAAPLCHQGHDLDAR